MIKLNFFKNGPIPEPKALPSSSAVHFIQSNTPAIVIATFQKVMEWVRPLFHYLFPNYVANANTKSVSLKTKTHSLPAMIKEWGQNHRSLLKKTAGLVLLFGTMYTAYKLFPFSKAVEESIPLKDELPGQNILDESLVKNSELSNYLPLVIILLFVAIANGALVGYDASIKRRKKLLNEKFCRLPFNLSLKTSNPKKIKEKIEKYFRKEIDINSMAYGMNILYAAISTKLDISVIKSLIDRGVDYNFIVSKGLNKGLSILHLAVKECKNDKDLKIVQLLLNQKGIKSNAKDLEGNTALHYAVDSGYFDCVKCLLNHDNIKINEKDSDGYTPLHIAVTLPHREKIVEFLVDQKGIKINEQNNQGETPLHLAILNEQIGSIELLITKGADVSITNNKGKRAADLTESDEIKKLLQNSSRSEKNTLKEIPFEIGESETITKALNKLDKKKKQEMKTPRSKLRGSL